MKILISFHPSAWALLRKDFSGLHCPIGHREPISKGLLPCTLGGKASRRDQEHLWRRAEPVLTCSTIGMCYPLGPVGHISAYLPKFWLCLFNKGPIEIKRTRVAQHGICYLMEVPKGWQARRAWNAKHLLRPHSGRLSPLYIHYNK